jgi:SAM-dependent methyltransferase
VKGTLPTKVGRLVSNLALRPRYLPRYVGHNVFADTTPLDLELPWFSYAAIDFLDEYLGPHMTVCEYGSGGSTLFCARRAKSVFAIEDNAQWFGLVMDWLHEKQIKNATVELFPFDFKNPVGFEASAYLNAIPDEKFDVIIVDGTEEWIPVRQTCFRHAERFIKPGGIIVVDDSWRYADLRTTHRANRVEVFQSVGPCRPGVTSTDVFFY